jgi:hypothetical protein
VRDEVGGQGGLAVAIVTMGKPDEAGAFCQRERLSFHCLSDPGRSAYRAYGLRRGTLNEVMGPEPLLGYMRAAMKGNFARVPVGDVYQLGGVFLVRTDGRLHHAHYPRHAGDHPPPGEIARGVAQLSKPS